MAAPVSNHRPRPVRNASHTERRQAIRRYVAVNKPAIGQLVQGVFDIRTLEEAERLSSMLAMQCPEPETAAVGIWELLSNAVEHGSLEIDGETKARLVLEGRYLDEIARRQDDELFRGRVVRVMFRKQARSIRIRVMDEGPGFDFSVLPRDLQPTEVPCGRGLALARSIAFDSVVFLGRGNIVDARIRVKMAVAPTS
ncbi:MAG TPA: ATP-binding protein [Rhabdaerophilum sp.]|nr:ATP-binding protein [Rhabdaerophilum sp.]